MKHGLSRSYTYESWSAMKRRCLAVNASDYPMYGGRGIKVCKRWMKFENFYEDMGERPKGKTLDRINSNGHYKPSNCRWATPKEQQNNKSSNVFLSYKGKRLSMYEWSRQTGICYETIQARLRSGWSTVKILTFPVTNTQFKPGVTPHNKGKKLLNGKYV